jgi:hypothetical protein
MIPRTIREMEPHIRQRYNFVMSVFSRMISSETPYKLAEIIRDTWPGLYTISKLSYNEKNTSDNERILDSERS